MTDKVCEWRRNEIMPDVWDTACSIGTSMRLNALMRFCPFCGRVLHVSTGPRVKRSGVQYEEEA